MVKATRKDVKFDKIKIFYSYCNLSRKGRVYRAIRTSKEAEALYFFRFTFQKDE